MKYENETFTNKTIGLDGNEFHNCLLDRCRIIYKGGAYDLKDTIMRDCIYAFDGSAHSTLWFLSRLYKFGAVDFVEGIFQQIRDGDEPLTPDEQWSDVIQ